MIIQNKFRNTDWWLWNNIPKNLLFKMFNRAVNILFTISWMTAERKEKCHQNQVYHQNFWEEHSGIHPPWMTGGKQNENGLKIWLAASKREKENGKPWAVMARVLDINTVIKPKAWAVTRRSDKILCKAWCVSICYQHVKAQADLWTEEPGDG